MKEYKPKPFTEALSLEYKEKIISPLEKKRTLCNVVKLIYRNIREDSYNLPAAKALLTEALWMGERMSAKLDANRKDELLEESLNQTEDDPSGVDWADLSKGNWD